MKCHVCVCVCVCVCNTFDDFQNSHNLFAGIHKPSFLFGLFSFGQIRQTATENFQNVSAWFLNHSVK